MAYQYQQSQKLPLTSNQWTQKKTHSIPMEIQVPAWDKQKYGGVNLSQHSLLINGSPVAIQIFNWTQTIRGQVVIPTTHYSDSPFFRPPFFRQPIAPTAHYSDSPLLRRPIIQTAHCSESPFLRQPIIPLKMVKSSIIILKPVVFLLYLTEDWL